MEVIKITCYIGLNDKDEHRQIVSTDDAINSVIGALACENIDGATISEAKGVWQYESEHTLRVEIMDAKIEGVKRAMLSLKKTLNQNAIALNIERIDSDLI